MQNVCVVTMQSFNEGSLGMETSASAVPRYCVYRDAQNVCAITIVGTVLNNDSAVFAPSRAMSHKIVSSLSVVSCFFRHL